MKECKWHLCQNIITDKRANNQRPCKKIFCSSVCKNRFHVQKRRMKLKLMALKYRGNKCEKCGYSGCTDAFDFHHLNSGEKDFKISSGNTMSWEEVKIELDKCILLCANCHRTEHYNLKKTKYILEELLSEI